ncbi:hypothetical protein R1sor_017075 [Riccia sorocarpa]|uniref:Uncharacterized protein n=1 Tax=Riccia sorocarpa TaxID=122646 RepID=A0ABD3I664_9MARC
MSLNFLTPSLRTVKRTRSKFVAFLPGLQFGNFQEVVNILKSAKEIHGIVGDVFVIFAEDETRVKPRISDGDTRRRKIMLEDYLSREGLR